MNQLTLFLSALFLFGTSVFSTNIYVKTADDGGDDTHSGFSWDQAKATIQAAVNIAQSGDCIFIKYGTYDITSTIVILNKSIRFTSDDGSHTTWELAVPDSSLCILHAAWRCRVFDARSTGTDSICVRGLWIFRGDATRASDDVCQGGGFYLSCNTVIQNSQLTECYANSLIDSPTGYGGAIFVAGAHLLEVRSSRLAENVASNSYGYGGAIAVPDNNTVVNIVGNSFLLNFGAEGDEQGNGGAIYGGHGLIEGNTFSSNAAARIGGNGWCSGGAIFGMDGTITNNVFDSNVAAGDGTMGQGGAIEPGLGCVITNNVFRNNSASWCTCGGRGGAIMAGTPCTITNNVFYGNVDGLPSSNRNGSAIYCDFNTALGTIVIRNNIFDSQTSTGTPSCAVYSSDPITIDYNCFYNNSLNYNTDKVTSDAAHQVEYDPEFSDVQNGDFTLACTSPCIDAGDPASAVPLGGEPAVDIGAFEYVSTAPVSCVDIDCSIDDNFIQGAGIALCAESGTVGALAQQTIGDPPGIPFSSRHIGKYWQLSSVSGGSIRPRLYFPANSLASFTGQPTIFHLTGLGWKSLSTTEVETTGTSCYVETELFYREFSTITVADGDAPLPVEAEAFVAESENGAVTLSWRTHTEVDNAGFIVLRRESIPRNIPREREFMLISSCTTNRDLEGLGTSTSGRSYVFCDRTVVCGMDYEYKLQSVSRGGLIKEVAALKVRVGVPTDYSLLQNFPNPFNPNTTITYQLPFTTHVLLKVYDVLGREVSLLVNRKQIAGTHTVEFQAGDLASGVYFYRLKSVGQSSTNKMILLR